MTYPEKLAELVDDFQSIDDRMERLEYVFDLASEVNELPNDEWTANCPISPSTLDPGTSDALAFTMPKTGL